MRVFDPPIVARPPMLGAITTAQALDPWTGEQVSMHPSYATAMTPQMVPCPDGSMVPIGLPCPEAPWYTTPIGIFGILAVIAGGIFLYKRGHTS